MSDEKKITANTDETPNTEKAAQAPGKDSLINNEEPKTELKSRRKKRDRNSESIAEGEAEASDNVLDAPSLDSLIIDDAPITSANRTEERGGFEDFLADYKNVIKKTLSAARSALGKAGSDDAGTPEHGEENEALSGNNDTEEQNSDGLFIQDDADAQLSMNIDEEMLPEENVLFADPEESKSTYDPEKPRTIDNIFDFVELFVFTLAAVLIFTTFFFKHTIVDGPSMMNTLQHQDHLIISDLFYTPERGDIVVFQDPVITENNPYVKRVIAIAGDTVTVDGNGKVTVNGEKIDESDYVFIDGNVPYNGKTVVVPEGEVFVLGDHRNNSRDSASFPEGTVKVDSILGKVLLRIYPFDKIGTVD